MACSTTTSNLVPVQPKKDINKICSDVLLEIDTMLAKTSGGANVSEEASLPLVVTEIPQSFSRPAPPAKKRSAKKNFDSVEDEVQSFLDTLLPQPTSITGDPQAVWNVAAAPDSSIVGFLSEDCSSACIAAAHDETSLQTDDLVVEARSVDDNDDSSAKVVDEVQSEAVIEATQASSIDYELQSEVVDEIQSAAITEAVQASSIDHELQSEVVDGVQSAAITEAVQASSIDHEFQSEVVDEIQSAAITEAVQASSIDHELQSEVVVDEAAVIEEVQVSSIDHEFQSEVVDEIQSAAIIEAVQASSIDHEFQSEVVDEIQSAAITEEVQASSIDHEFQSESAIDLSNTPLEVLPSLVFSNPNPNPNLDSLRPEHRRMSRSPLRSVSVKELISASDADQYMPKYSQADLDLAVEQAREFAMREIAEAKRESIAADLQEECGRLQLQLDKAVVDLAAKANDVLVLAAAIEEMHQSEGLQAVQTKAITHRLQTVEQELLEAEFLRVREVQASQKAQEIEIQKLVSSPYL